MLHVVIQHKQCYKVAYFLMTLTAQPLLSFSFLAISPLQQVSIFVAGTRTPGRAVSKTKNRPDNEIPV